MKIIVHSMIGDDAIKGSLGVDDYSYVFVRRFFTEALQRFADVVSVADPVHEVDPIYDQARADGEDCLFLCFAPPNKVVLGLRCPTVPVFAWEFSTIPYEVWNDDIRNDWRAVFAISGAAIALSCYTVSVVRVAVGNGFPIVAIPAPVFERFEQQTRRAIGEQVELRLAGTVLDTDCIDAFRSDPVWPRRPVPLLTPAPLPPLVLPAREPEPEPACVLLIEPDIEHMPRLAFYPEPEILVDPQAVVMLVQEPVAIEMIEPRIGWRRRVQITRHFGLEWYRLAVRDLLPGPVRSANALAGRTMHRVYRQLRPKHAVHVDQALSVETKPIETVLLEPLEVIEPPPVPAEPEELIPVEAETELVPIVDPSPLAELVPVAVSPPPPPMPVTTVALDGVVFVSMFSPRDGRKNWNDIVTAFCWAHRDTPDATLVLKIVATDHGYEPGLRRLLEELAPFRCRVVVLHGYLETPEYRALIGAASFYVNASHCEGLCLPMTEFMSAGTPAIAPNHTAFEDYISPDNALIIESGIENTVWPGDGRDLFRTTRYRIDWHGLMLAYREGYQVAKTDPERYRAMSDSARETMRRFCGIEPVTQALRTFLSGRAGTGLERAA